MLNIKKIADQADLIVNGYAFKKCDIGFKVINLNNPKNAVVFSNIGEVLETTMNDIEINIVSDYLKQNRKYMED